MAHRSAPPGGGAELVRADLAVADSLRGSCAGVDVVLHCASRIGGDEAGSAAVNDLGTRNLVDEATRGGVRRFVYVSTAAVYGRGPFTALRPDGAPLAPASATSRSRAAAERHVLAAGGVVLRPHLVYGRGDKWVIPGLVMLLRRLSAGLSRCRARHSLIDARSLGRLAVAAALAPRAAGVYHVNHPDPVGVAELLSTVDAGLRLGLDRRASVPAARAMLAASEPARRHLEMLAVDHWFADDRVWADLGCGPGAGFATTFRRHAAWYRRQLAAAPRSG
ncbi:hypothetical protein Adi01nite_34730 [Amorphoplanes digitatis]|nr:hypothetical protein Adi01nite_34730 [Actinoplanes digitatis]